MMPQTTRLSGAIWPPPGSGPSHISPTASPNASPYSYPSPRICFQYDNSVVTIYCCITVSLRLIDTVLKTTPTDDLTSSRGQESGLLHILGSGPHTATVRISSAPRARGCWQHSVPCGCLTEGLSSGPAAGQRSPQLLARWASQNASLLPHSQKVGITLRGVTSCCLFGLQVTGPTHAPREGSAQWCGQQEAESRVCCHRGRTIL